MAKDNPKTQSNPGAKILICGSSHLTDKNFVIETLNMLNMLLWRNFNCGITEIHTSRFSGACEFARDWAELYNENAPANQRIKIKEFTFDTLVEKQNHSFFNEAEIPSPVLPEDDFFVKGKEELIRSGIRHIMAFPNEKNEVGVSTNNILRFAELAEIKPFNCRELYNNLLEQKARFAAQPENNTTVDCQAEQQAAPKITNRRALVR